MMPSVLLGLACLCLGASTSSAWTKAPTYEVVEVRLRSDREFEVLRRLAQQLPGFEIWSDAPRADGVTVLIRSADRHRLDSFETTTVVPDWDAYQQELLLSGGDVEFLAGYHTYAEYITYLDWLGAAFPGLARTIDFGVTVQGRTLTGIRISGAESTAPAVFLHGVQHGNEKTNAPVLVYLADYLLQNYAVDEEIRFLVDHTEWYIVPVTNPDGHELGRRANAHNVDLNRDWGDVSENGGFTQPETVAMRDLLLSLPNLAWHLDMHTGAQMTLWPWGPTARRCWAYETLDRVSLTLSTALPTFSVYGPIYSTLYPIRGCTTDYVYGQLGSLSLTVEVSPQYAVLPSALPTYEALMRDYILQLVRWRHDCDGAAAPGPDCPRSFSDTPGLVACLAGPAAAALGDACRPVDWDNDSDVDLRDAARLLDRFAPVR